MSDELTHAERCLLELLSASLTGGAPGELSQSDLAQSMAIADSHGVLPLLYPVLEGERDEGLRRRTEIRIRQSYRLWFLSRYYAGLLEDAGITDVVLKGAGVSALYPVPEYRKSGDVDLLLPDVRDLERACKVLEGAGLRRKKEQHANHHIAFVGTDGIELELHISLTEDFDDGRVNEWLRELQRSLARHIVRTEIVPGLAAPVLEDGYQAFSLLLHMLQHFLRSGFGLRLLCDWVVFWNRPVGEKQRSVYLSLVKECGLEGFSRLITRTCALHLGLEADRAALLLAGGDGPSDGTCAQFLREIFDAQEFGKTSTDRMVTLRGTGVIDYVREFHHQMRLNFPRAGRWVPLWPALWLATLVRFLYNNHAVRKTSLFSILRKTGQRSRFMEEIRLFQRD